MSRRLFTKGLNGETGCLYQNMTHLRVQFLGPSEDHVVRHILGIVFFFLHLLFLLCLQGPVNLTLSMS